MPCDLVLKAVLTCEASDHNQGHGQDVWKCVCPVQETKLSCVHVHVLCKDSQVKQQASGNVYMHKAHIYIRQLV